MWGYAPCVVFWGMGVEGYSDRGGGYAFAFRGDAAGGCLYITHSRLGIRLRRWGGRPCGGGCLGVVAGCFNRRV